MRRLGGRGLRRGRRRVGGIGRWSSRIASVTVLYTTVGGMVAVMRTDFLEQTTAWYERQLLSTQLTADIRLDRDLFMRTLIRELSGTLEDVVGLKEAAGFASVVGQTVGEMIDREYKRALDTPSLSRPDVARVLVDLKRRIHGDFYVIAEDEDKIVLGNRACPFGDKVLGRTSMCMMTSNVFGYIAAENLGYAKVELQETIASGHPGCRVVVYLRRSPRSDAIDGREYFKGQ